jgi:small-conductance mechanosensitive channel
MNEYFIIIPLLVIFILMSKQVNKQLIQLGNRKNVSSERIFYIQKTVQVLLFITALFTIALLLGINYDKFGFILSTIFTLVGVALFAQWSILSNVTASLIIFFFFPYRVGDTIKIQDDSELLEGCIEEITLFHLLIRRAEGDIISYPNSLVFQKAIIIKPRVNNIENDKKQH